jgi:hypothetical protein
VARTRLRATIARLRILGPASSDAAEIADAWVARKLVVIMDLGAGGNSSECVSASSVGRELQYLVAHTVHHFALMAVALRTCGHRLPDEFGVAPSTLRHEESSNGACAR